jgi:glycosyltransferase involved in cell wall biosynthesis
VSIANDENLKFTPGHSGVTVLIPAFNEEMSVGDTVTHVRQHLQDRQMASGELVEILVIDDGSTDGTAERARASGARVISHRTNLGYGASLKTGLRRATFETIVITDADATYPCEAIPDLLADLAECDMAVAARTGANVNIPAARKPAKWVLNTTAQFLAGRRIPDLNSGMRAFYKSQAMQFLNLYPGGFSFTTTITLAYLSNDLLIHYRPIDYHPRAGKSKLQPIRDTRRLFLSVIRCILFFNPLRVCIPIAAVLIVVAGYFALFIRDRYGNIMDGTITSLVLCAVQVVIMGFLADVMSKWRR